MNAPLVNVPLPDAPLRVAGRDYRSRLLVGTGKYKDFAETRAAVEASGADIVTVAIRRTNLGQEPGAPSLLDFLPPSRSPATRCGWPARCGSRSRPDARPSSPAACRASSMRRAQVQPRRG